MSLSAFIVSPSPFTLFLAGFILIALEVEVCMSQNTSYWISEEAEVSLRKPKDGVLISGDEITLKCGVDGLPQPLVTWYHNQQPITLLLENTYSILEPNKLRIHKLSALEHNGVYTCKGENEAGTSSVTTSFVLSVAEPNLPYLSDSLFSKTTVTLPGRDVWLHCMFVNAESICWVRCLPEWYPTHQVREEVG
ncbi:PTK7 [Bugula neritina]|uniref:PTK7 n=1 Tax=Bugula neritina TaxID=10212 RepID=A0A7J7JBH6_BUGNE|nr:PTK7 [Bugula neritina]